VLLGGDATEEEESEYEGSQTLIAIGLQSGKVLIFNVLGLLVHEIQVDHLVIALEWVGDMSAPSILPNRVSSLSPEPGPVIGALFEDMERRTSMSTPLWLSSPASPSKIRTQPTNPSTERMSRTSRYPTLKPTSRHGATERASSLVLRSRFLRTRRESTMAPAATQADSDSPTSLHSRGVDGQSSATHLPQRNPYPIERGKSKRTQRYARRYMDEAAGKSGTDPPRVEIGGRAWSSKPLTDHLLLIKEVEDLRDGQVVLSDDLVVLRKEMEALREKFGELKGGLAQ
jgi:hypothetical protein